MHKQEACRINEDEPVKVKHMFPATGWRIARIHMAKEMHKPTGTYPMFELKNDSPDVENIKYITYKLVDLVS